MTHPTNYIQQETLQNQILLNQIFHKEENWAFFSGSTILMNLNTAHNRMTVLSSRTVSFWTTVHEHHYLKVLTKFPQRQYLRKVL